MKIGTDIIEISRIEGLVGKDAFLQRVFTDYERTYAASRGVQQAASLAGIYAAKEACMKALGLGMRQGTWQDIEITHDELGAPILHCYGPFKERMKALGFVCADVSISHCREYATSVVLLH